MCKTWCKLKTEWLNAADKNCGGKAQTLSD